LNKDWNGNYFRVWMGGPRDRGALGGRMKRIKYLDIDDMVI